LPSEAQADAEDDGELEVWPEHWNAVRIFEASQTQWSVLVGMGGIFFQGLDMARVELVREWLGIEKSEALLLQLRVMAEEAKKYLNA
jgi:hypothetical protein